MKTIALARYCSDSFVYRTCSKAAETLAAFSSDFTRAAIAYYDSNGSSFSLAAPRGYARLIQLP